MGHLAYTSHYVHRLIDATGNFLSEATPRILHNLNRFFTMGALLSLLLAHRHLHPLRGLPEPWIFDIVEGILHSTNVLLNLRRKLRILRHLLR